jgi:hypothetical protein
LLRFHPPSPTCGGGVRSCSTSARSNWCGGAAAVLAAHAHKGPAEIPGKREFTYRHVLWQAAQEGVVLRFPPAHPFNPLAALRLCVAAGSRPEAVTAIFDWIWARGGRPQREALPPAAAALIDTDTINDGHSPRCSNTDAALAAVSGPRLRSAASFSGATTHEFALAALRDPAVMATRDAAGDGVPVGVSRRI